MSAHEIYVAIRSWDQFSLLHLLPGVENLSGPPTEVDICSACSNGVEAVKSWVNGIGGIKVIFGEMTKNICGAFPEDQRPECHSRLKQRFSSVEMLLHNMVESGQICHVMFIFNSIVIRWNISDGNLSWSPSSTGLIQGCVGFIVGSTNVGWSLECRPRDDPKRCGVATQSIAQCLQNCFISCCL